MEQKPAYQWIADQLSKALIADVIGAELVTVHKQDTGTVQLNQPGVRDQSATTLFLKPGPQQEVAVSVLKIDGSSPPGQGAERLQYWSGAGGGQRVSQPDLKQVPQDIECPVLTRLSTQKVEKALYRLRLVGREVEIGDEAGRHLLQATPLQ